jgi:hypothetical protein
VAESGAGNDGDDDLDIELPDYQFCCLPGASLMDKAIG